MTETAVILPPQTSASPEVKQQFELVKSLIDDIAQFRAEKDAISKKIDAALQELDTVAKSLSTRGIYSDGIHTLEYKMRRKPAKINVDRLKESYPLVYAEAYPHVKDNIAVDILEEHFGGDKKAVQEMLRSVNPDLFDKNIVVNKKDLEEAVSKDTKLMAQMEVEGIIMTEMVPVGEPELHLIGYRRHFVGAPYDGLRYEQEKEFCGQIQKNSSLEEDFSNFSFIPSEIEEDGASRGSSDAGNVSQAVPLATLSVATTVKGTGLHTWQQAALAGTTVGTKAISVVAKVFYLSALDLYGSPDLVKDIWNEYYSVQGHDYHYETLVGDREPPLDYCKR